MVVCPSVDRDRHDCDDLGEVASARHSKRYPTPDVPEIPPLVTRKSGGLVLTRRWARPPWVCR